MHCKPEMVQKGGREAMQEQSKQAAARKKETAVQMVKIGRKKCVTAILSGMAADEYMTKTELAEALGKDKPANLKLINEMIEDGLIEKFVPTKKRAKQHTEGCRLSGKEAQEYENLSNGK
jgi:predicted HTH transcriptional regulator